MEIKALTILATIRRRQASWTPGVLGLFVVMWLNLALAPCAMALGDDHEHGCPRCPPSHATEQGDGHHGHDEPGGAIHHETSADVPAGGMVCADAPGACDALDVIHHDGRTVPLKVNDTPQDAPVAMLVTERVVHGARLVQSDPVFFRNRVVPGYPPPLTILYGVYRV